MIDSVWTSGWVVGELNEQLWWHVARSSGIVSWVAVTASVLWGLMLSSRLMSSRAGSAWLLEVHRFLGGLSVVFLAIHLGGLVGDGYVTFGLAELFVPGASSWQPWAVAWGIAAMYLIVAVEITSLLMHQIPRRLWRWVHFSSFAIYVLATVHMVTAGTDRTSTILRWSALGSVQLVLGLVGVRLLTTRGLKQALRATSSDAGLAEVTVTIDGELAARLSALRERRPAPCPEPATGRLVDRTQAG